MVAVDAGLSYERTLGLKFHDAIEELASPVVPGVLVSACTNHILANRTHVYIPDRQEEGHTATSPTTRSYIVTTPSGGFR